MKKIKNVIIGMLAVLLLFDPVMVRQIAYAFDLIDEVATTSVEIETETALFGEELANTSPFDFDIHDIFDEWLQEQAINPEELMLPFRENLAISWHIHQGETVVISGDEKTWEVLETSATGLVQMDGAQNHLLISNDVFGQLANGDYQLSIKMAQAGTDEMLAEVTVDFIIDQELEEKEKSHDLDLPKEETSVASDVIEAANINDDALHVEDYDELTEFDEMAFEFGHVGNGFDHAGATTWINQVKGENVMGEVVFAEDEAAFVSFGGAMGQPTGTGMIFSGDMRITRNNFMDFFYLSGRQQNVVNAWRPTWNAASGNILVTQEAQRQVGTVTLIPRIDMNYDFDFSVNILLGRSSQQARDPFGFPFHQNNRNNCRLDSEFAPIPDLSLLPGNPWLHPENPCTSIVVGPGSSGERRGNRGADGLSFAFHPNDSSLVGSAGNGRGVGGVANAFGFGFDTWWNNGPNNNIDQGTGSGGYGADPRRFSNLSDPDSLLIGGGDLGVDGTGVPFAGFIVTRPFLTDGTESGISISHNYMGESYVLPDGERPSPTAPANPDSPAFPQQLGNGTPGSPPGGSPPAGGSQLPATGSTVGTLNPTNNAWHHVNMFYTASTGYMTVVYTHSSALMAVDGNPNNGFIPDPALVAANPDAQQRWTKNIQYLVDHDDLNMESFSFVMTGSTGTSTNEHGVSIIDMSYRAMTGDVNVRYFQDDVSILEAADSPLLPMEKFVDLPEDWTVETSYSASDYEDWERQVEERLKDAGWYRTRTDVNVTRRGASLDADSWNYVSIPSDNFTNTPHMVASGANTNGTITYFFRRAYGTIELTKLDHSGQPLPNVEFELRDEEGTYITTLITDANGKATTETTERTNFVETDFVQVHTLGEGLSAIGAGPVREVATGHRTETVTTGTIPTGVYYLHEINTPAPHVLREPIRVYVPFAESQNIIVPVEVQNFVARGAIEVQKQDVLDQPLGAGFTYAVYEVNDAGIRGERIAEIITDDSGIARTEMAPTITRTGYGTGVLQPDGTVLFEIQKDIIEAELRLNLGHFDIIEIDAPFPYVVDSNWSARVEIVANGDQNVETIIARTSQRNFRYPEASITVGNGGMNPETITGSPRTQTIEGEDITLGDSTMRWEIHDSLGRVIHSGPGSEIPPEIIGNLPNGDYRAYMFETLPEAERQGLAAVPITEFPLGFPPWGPSGEHGVSQDFTIQRPDITVTLDRDINPTEIVGSPSVPGTDVTFEDRFITWEIREAGTYVLTGEMDELGDPIYVYQPGPIATDADGRELTGQGTVIPEDVLKQMPAGDYRVTFTVTDPATGLSADDSADFTVRFPSIEADIDRVINPEEIVIKPSIPGVSTDMIPDDAIAWEIHNNDGNLVISGNGNTWWQVDPETGERLPNTGGEITRDEFGNVVVSIDVLQSLADGGHTITFKITDPVTKETAAGDLDFIIRTPKVNVSGDRPFNPEYITGVPNIPGISGPNIPDENILWQIRDENGQPIFGGDGSVWWTFQRDEQGQLILDDQFNPIPVIEGAVNRETNTGAVVIPPVIIDQLPDGNYSIEFVTIDPETEQIARDDWEFSLVSPDVDVNRPFQPEAGDLILVPGYPGSELEWTISGPDGPIIGGNGDEWWFYERDLEGNLIIEPDYIDDGTGQLIENPEAGNFIREPNTGGPIVRDPETGAITLPPNVIGQLPGGDYNLSMVENHPEYGELGRDNNDFTISRPELGIDRPVNPDEIGIIPGHPETELEWSISGPEGPIIGGDRENWWHYERDSEGNLIQIPGGELEIDPETGAIIITPEIVDQLPEGGDYILNIIEDHPEHGIIRDEDQDLIITRPELGIDRPVNPDEIGIIPGHPETELEWSISGPEGPIIGGDRENWWHYERDSEGNLIQIPGGALEIDPETGAIIITPEIVDQLPEGGDYILNVIEDHPEHGIIRDEDRELVITRPEFGIDRPVNPDEIGIIPGHPETDLEWSISGPEGPIIGGDRENWWFYERDSEGNLIQIPGGELEIDPETGAIIITPEIVDQLPEGGDYILNVIEDHPEHGIIRDEDRELVITRPEFGIDRPVNPDEIGIIPGHPETELEWSISGPDGPIIGGDRENWWIYERDSEGNLIQIPGGELEIDPETGAIIITPEIVDQLPEGGNYILNVTEDHPEHGIIRDEDRDLVITRPGLGIDRPFNPEDMVVIPGHPDTDLSWEIRDEAGNVVAGGDGENWWEYERDELGNNILDENGHPLRRPDTGGVLDRDLETGAIILPPEVIDQLPGGDYVLIITEDHPEHGIIRDDANNFSVVRPGTDLNRPSTPGQVGIRPGHPDTDTTWIIEDGAGNVIAEGDEINWWLVDEDGNRIPNTGGMLTRDEETGIIILPPDLINNLPEGDYLLIVIESHPEFGQIAREEGDILIREPIINIEINGPTHSETNRPINPDKIIGQPSVPGSPGAVFGNEHIVWSIRDEAGNVIATGNGREVPADVIEGLPNGNYQVTFTVTDPLTNRKGTSVADFIIRYPQITVEIEDCPHHHPGVNPEQIIGRPTLPDSEVTWLIRDAEGNIVAEGAGPIIDNNVIMNLPEGIYDVQFREYDPKTGESATDDSRFLRCNNDVLGNGIVNLDREQNPGNIEFIPRVPGGTATWIIRDVDGNIVAEGEGLRIPDDVLYQLVDGDYSIEWTYRCPITQNPTTAPAREFTRERGNSTPSPGITAEVDRPVNPESITGTPTNPNDEVTWVIRDSAGNIIAEGVGTSIPSSVIESLANGTYRAEFTVTCPETHRTATDDVAFTINRQVDPERPTPSPGITAEVDRPINPESITGTPTNPNDEVTWVIRDSAGNIIAEGVGTSIPSSVIESLANGTYRAEFTVTCPETHRTATDDVAFTINRQVDPERPTPAPGITAEVDRPINPESITGTPTNPNDEVTWVIRDADGNIIAEGVGTSIPSSVIDSLPNGNYRAEFTVTCPETHRTATDDVAFTINRQVDPERPTPSPGITAEVDRPVNPESITGTPTNPNDEVTWVIRDAEGNIVAEGVGTSIPSSVIDSLPNGNYRAEFTVTCPETHRTATDSVDFVINRSPSSIVNRKPNSPNLPQTGHALGMSFVLLGKSTVLLGIVSLLLKKRSKI